MIHLSIADILNQTTLLSEEQLLEIQNSSREEVIDAVLGSLAYPNLNALIAAYHVPHESYEAQLLNYQKEHMQDEHTIYWMLSLGKIGSEKAFDRIAQYTETNLFHQAFVSLAEIDLSRTMAVFEKFLDKNCTKYDKNNTTFGHDSGFNTLTCLIKNYPAARDLVKNYNLSKNKQKKGLIQDAVNYNES